MEPQKSPPLQNGPSHHSPRPFSLEKLQQLIARSASYAELDQDTKDKIQKYIQLNDKPALIFIYQTLLEEEAENQVSREKLQEEIVESGQRQSQKAAAMLKKLGEKEQK